MLSIRIKINSIDYENTFQQIFPMARKKIEGMEIKNMLIRLFQKLDNDALPVLLGIMHRLPEETKNELLVLCLNTYAPKLGEKLNEELSNDEWGKNFTVGRLWIEQDGHDLFVQINQVEVEYKSLLDMDVVEEKLSRHLGSLTGVTKGLVGLAVTIAPDALEKKGLELLWKDTNKQKLMSIAKDTLDKYGVVMDLIDIEIKQDTAKGVNHMEKEMNLVLTEKMESEILDALAGYLKDKNKD